MANIFQAIMDHETSGGHNVNNYLYNGGAVGSDGLRHTASGYFQITDTTWAGTTAGQQSGFTHALDAPYATQQAVAAELISKNGLNDWAPYDGIKGSASSYDQTPLSGPGGSAATGVVSKDPSGYMTVTDTLGTDPNGGSGTSTQNGAGFSSGAASGQDSAANADGKLNPATVPLAITTSQSAADATSTANTKSATTAFTGGVKSITDTAKASYAAAHDALGDTLFRVALIVIGGIVLLGALWIIAAEQGAAPKPSTVLKKGAMALAA